MRRALCIWLPDWPVQRILAARPELRDRAIVLHERHRGGRRVVGCSMQAKALGIVPGMPLAEATALGEQGAGSRGQGAGRSTEYQVRSTECSASKEEPIRGNSHSTLRTRYSVLRTPRSLLPAPSDPVVDREALEQLAVECFQFAPVVGVEDAPAPEGLFLDITGLEHLFGGEAALAEKVLRHFANRGLTTRIAAADTLGAAWAAAHFHEQFSIFNFQFSISNPKPEPPLPCILPPGQTLPALRPLPIESLRLPAETAGLLHALGIYRVEQLERLPRAELTARFGAALLRRWDQAMGRLPEPIPAQQPPPELEARLSLEYPTVRRETMEQILEQLIGRVAESLVRCGCGALRLECRLECQSTRPVELSVGLFEASVSARHLFQLLRMQLERLRLPAPVVGMSVAAAATAPFQRRQEELFSDGPARQFKLLAALIDRLSSRLGRASVLRARLVADAQPEAAWQYEPMVGNCKLQIANCKLGIGRRRAGVCKEEERELPQRPPRPLRLVRAPVAVSTVSVHPDGPPLRFRFKGEEHTVANLWGPERIETGWWRGPMIARDYYRIETASGRRYWVFRSLTDGRWFLHGGFE